MATPVTTKVAIPMITGCVSEAEFIEAHRLHRRRFAVGVNAAMACLAVAGVSMFLAVSRKWGVMLVFGAIGGIIGEMVLRLYLRRRLRKLYAQLSGRTDVSYSWTAETLSIRSEYGHAERPWSVFVKAKENEQVLLMYLNDALFEIIAKRWFPSPEALEDFRSRLNLVN